MPERMRIALCMFRIEERPMKTIAGELGITVSGVEKLLQRAYRRLHDADDGGGADSPDRRRPDDMKDSDRER